MTLTYKVRDKEHYYHTPLKKKGSLVELLTNSPQMFIFVPLDMLGMLRTVLDSQRLTGKKALYHCKTQVGYLKMPI